MPRTWDLWSFQNAKRNESTALANHFNDELQVQILIRYHCPISNMDCDCEIVVELLIIGFFLNDCRTMAIGY